MQDFQAASQGDETQKEREFIISVNSRKKEWLKEDLSYEEVVTLAYGSYSNDPTISYTVTFAHGPRSNPEGSLVKGKSVKIKSGMIFNVTHTNRS